MVQLVKPTCSVGDPGSTPGSGRYTGEGTGYPLQYSALENSMDYGPWVHRVRYDWARIQDWFKITFLGEPKLKLSLSLIIWGASLVAQMVKNLPAVQETRFDPWVRNIPWRRKWQLTPSFLPRESHGQRSLVGPSHGVANSRTRLSD